MPPPPRPATLLPLLSADNTRERGVCCIEKQEDEETARTCRGWRGSKRKGGACRTCGVSVDDKLSLNHALLTLIGKALCTRGRSHPIRWHLDRNRKGGSSSPPCARVYKHLKTQQPEPWLPGDKHVDIEIYRDIEIHADTEAYSCSACACALTQPCPKPQTLKPLALPPCPRLCSSWALRPSAHSAPMG